MRVPGFSRTTDVHFPCLSRSSGYISCTCTKSTKQQIEPSLTVDYDNVRKGRKHLHGSEMWQPFGLFSVAFHDFPGSVCTLLTRNNMHSVQIHQNGSDIRLPVSGTTEVKVEGGILTCHC